MRPSPSFTRCPCCGAAPPAHARLLFSTAVEAHPPASPYDPAWFADLICHDPADAAARLAALSIVEQERQIAAYVAWLARYHLHTTTATVRSVWTRLADPADRPLCPAEGGAP